ncbi:riboflavin synthase [Dongshaea marina]|uniref:riboflavin synthase n=1 Tax=Dongshaea marina TaxID=2047966 RepID=UPI000D3E5139|nr:riboflavin synthase [Dongshaea marina]
MFTGIIEAVGQLRAIHKKGSDYSVQIDTAALDLSDVKLGDSIATNGVCLTVVRLLDHGFEADVSGETIRRTGFAHYRPNQSVNLEKALTLSTRLGGHLVSGHVDGVAEVVSRKQHGRAIEFWMKAPRELARYIAEKGSVTVDGVSLTVNDVRAEQFLLTIVPHTLEQTSIDSWQAGGKINLEVDLLARYLERLFDPTLRGESSSKGEGLEQLLMKNGFMR